MVKVTFTLKKYKISRNFKKDDSLLSTYKILEDSIEHSFAELVFRISGMGEKLISFYQLIYELVS